MPELPHDFLIPAHRDDRAVRRQAERHELAAIRRGVYADAQAWSGFTSRQRLVLRAAALSGLRPDTVFSHATAAAIWNLDWLGNWPGRLDATAEPEGIRQKRKTFSIHPGPLRPDQVRTRSGLLVTSRARTAADLLLSLDEAHSLVPLDFALRRTGLRKDEIAAELDARPRLRGSTRARRGLDFADRRSMSAGESWSRLLMHQTGLVRPVLQEPFYDADGKIGVVDFWWPECGVIGEFDGHGKYLRDMYLKGRTTAEVVMEEKAREDRLRALPSVRRVVRWEWHELDARTLHAKISRAGVPRAA